MQEDIQLIASKLSDIEIKNIKNMIELGKKNDGTRLSVSQIEACLQLLIAWEESNLPKNMRTGYLNKKCQNKTQSMLIENVVTLINSKN